MMNISKPILLSGLVFFILAVVWTVPRGSRAEEKPWGIGAESAFNSKYIWRGTVPADEPVWQPTIALTYRWLTASWWGNLELTDGNGHSGEFTEMDYTIELAGQMDIFAVTAGALVYQFPNTGLPATTELYAGMGLDVPLSPSLTVYQDVDEVGGTYVNIAGGYGFELWKPSEVLTLSLDCSASIGLGSSQHNEGYYCSADNFACASRAAFTDVFVSLALPVSVKGNLGIVPSVQYTGILDGGIREVVDTDQAFQAGMRVSGNF